MNKTLKDFTDQELQQELNDRKANKKLNDLQKMKEERLVDYQIVKTKNKWFVKCKCPYCDEDYKYDFSYTVWKDSGFSRNAVITHPCICKYCNFWWDSFYVLEKGEEKARKPTEKELDEHINYHGLMLPGFYNNEL